MYEEQALTSSLLPPPLVLVAPLVQLVFRDCQCVFQQPLEVLVLLARLVVMALAFLFVGQCRPAFRGDSSSTILQADDGRGPTINPDYRVCQLYNCPHLPSAGLGASRDAEIIVATESG
jgi:hypothetical protein